MTRRDLLKTGILASAGALALPTLAQGSNKKMQMSFFSKPLHWMDYEQLADCLAAIGVDGIDLTVRPKGHVLPENVRTDLPRAIKAAQSRGLKVNMIVTAIQSADEEHAQTVLKTAADHGVKLYRMGYLRYDYKDGIVRSLDNLKKTMESLAALNQKIGIVGGYQNHYAWKPELLGGPLWDLHYVLKDIDPRVLGSQFDVRHAIAESPSSWSNGLRLIAPWINSICLKDFDFKDERGKLPMPRQVPAGEGLVPWQQYIDLLKELRVDVPATIHLEWEMLSKEEKSLPVEKKTKLTIERCAKECAFHRRIFAQA